MAGFEVLDELGRGGRTVTYRVRRHGSTYAMKVLRPSTGEDGPSRAFRREAALLASVAEPGLVRVHEVGVAEGLPYLVMDYVDGRPLSALVADGPLPVDQTVRIGIDVGRALAAAHQARLVHRDIKPENILVSAAGQARVIDFGLAVRPGDLDEATTAGTLLYSAPEQAGMLHRPVDGRADLYALGAVLFQCATGHPPFLAANVGELLRRHASTAAPDPRASRPELPPALATLIVKLLAKDPDDRYQSAAGLVADLERIAAGATDFVLATADGPGGRVERPLIGRDDELARLLARWQQVRAGTGGVVVLVEGAPGSGKSRLAWELTTTVRAAGGLVLLGGCRPEEGVPLAPIRQAIEAHLATLATLPAGVRETQLDQVRAAAGPTASLLRGLSPALDDLLAAPDLADEDRHQQFSVAVASFLAALAGQAGGAVLHLDDVQWLSASTRRVLQLLASRFGEAPLLVLATGRDGATDAEAIAALRAAAGPRLELALRLPPLPVASVAALVSAATGGLSVDGSIAASLAARSDGNTFTLLQYLDAALDAGLLRPDWGQWRLDPDDLRAVELPGPGVNVILGRLDRLDAQSRSLLGIAAVVGSVFDHELVADAAALPPTRVLELADAAAWSNLIERRDAGRYAFLHDRIREALLAQFDATALRAVHQRIANALARRPHESAEAVFALARHCLLGEPQRDPVRVFHACAAAGRIALDEHAPVEALRYLDRAAEIAQGAGLVLESGFLAAHATAQYRSGRFGDAARTARLGYERATDKMERARILSLAAQALDTAWQTDEETEAIEQALVELGRSRVRGTPGEFVATFSTVLLGQLRRLTRIGVGTARGHEREHLQLVASLYAAGAWATARQLHAARALLFTLRQVYPAIRLGQGPEVARLRIGLAYVNMAMGQLRAGQRNADRARVAAVTARDPLLSAHVSWVEAFNRHSYGIDQGESLRRLLAEHGPWLELGQQSDVIFMLLWDALQRGKVREAADYADRRLALIELIGDTRTDLTRRFESGTAVRGAIASLLAWQGHRDEARAMLGPVPDPEVTRQWERLPIYGAAMVVAYEAEELDERFDRAVAEFDSLGLPSRMMIPLGLGFYVVRALGRIEQCRQGPREQRKARLVVARAAVEQLRKAARTPLIRAHYETVRAALLELAGEPQAALAALARAEPALLAVDAPSVAFAAARVRAYALRDLHIDGEADRQARLAVTIAVEYQWPGRVRRTIAEFAVADPPVVRSAATTNEAIAVGRFRQRLDAIEQLGVAASRVLDPIKLAAIALDETIRILGAERAFLFLVDGRPPELVPHGGRDADGHDIDELTGYSRSTVERVRRSGQPVVITGTEDGAAPADSVVLHGLRSIMVAPIQLDGRLLGIVYLDSRVAKGIFTPEDVGVLIAITNHVAVALETARAAQLEVEVATANRQRDLAETLREALAEITGTLEPEPESVLLRLKRTTVGIVGGERAWLVLGTAQDNKIRLYPDDSDQPSTVELEPWLESLLTADTTQVGEARTGLPRTVRRGRVQLAGRAAAGARRAAGDPAGRLDPGARVRRRPGRPGHRAGRPGHGRLRERPPVRPGPAAGHHRRPDRHRQPAALLRTRGPGAGPHPACRRRTGRDDGRHRPLQEHQ